MPTSARWRTEVDNPASWWKRIGNEVDPIRFEDFERKRSCDAAHFRDHALPARRADFDCWRGSPHSPLIRARARLESILSVWPRWLGRDGGRLPRRPAFLHLRGIPPEQRLFPLAGTLGRRGLPPGTLRSGVISRGPAPLEREEPRTSSRSPVPRQGRAGSGTHRRSSASVYFPRRN